MSDDPRLSSPAAGRNRDPILAVLRRLLPATGLVLEVASGTGEHAAHLAAALPALRFQPTDPDPARRASIDAWCGHLPNVAPALALDTVQPWPVAAADAVFCANMIHIAPWPAALGLLAGARAVLPLGGLLALYGPFRREGQPLSDGNAAFDADLRARDPAWGLRVLEEVAAAAAGFILAAVEPMPAGNLLAAFRRQPA